jgi:hypothetical protein
MKYIQLLGVVALMVVSSLVMAQSKRDKNSDLEKVLWDADQEWLCAGPHLKPPKECIESRASFWGQQFFEIGGANVMSKAQMIASQMAIAPNTVPGTGMDGVFPGEFKLKAVYENFALATDRTAFKTLDANGLPAFTSTMQWLRLFVYENGRWRPAAGVGVPVVRRVPIPGAPAPAPSQQTSGNHRSPNEQLEKELAEIDTKWLDSAMHQRWDYLNDLFTDQWFEILGWDPTTDVTKEYAHEAIMKPNPNRKPGEGVFPDEFQLWADYGDVALATDRRTRHWTDAKGNAVITPHRTLLVFVKQDGKWRSAATALVPYVAP